MVTRKLGWNAFVYYCCIKVGFNIPIKYPNENVKCNFAGCVAWESWTNLPENLLVCYLKNYQKKLLRHQF